nr:ankyrin repeat domain-containing protein [uncultured Allomuricauda sp.]
MNRKEFLKNNLIIGGMAIGAPTLLIANSHTNQEEVFDKELIQAFVFAAHKSLEDTRKILEKHPLLLNCTNQFKKGDFETAIGGASHMGRRDVADYLVGKGARLDIFNYAFLGYDEIVKKLVQNHSNLLNAPGPHGFTLLHHAEVGERKELAKWLKSKGLTETHFKGIFG